MPELPEVETTRLGIEPHLEGQVIKQVIIRDYRLRWAIDSDLPSKLAGLRIISIARRGKYLLLQFKKGTLLIHLGMSGSLRVLKKIIPPKKHDHLDLILENGTCLRLTDPRRFGAVLWTTEDLTKHKLLKALGPEPLSREFTATYLFNKTRTKKAAIKLLIMDSKIVVGVGNIYANEALFKAGIHPTSPAKTIDKEHYQKLVLAIKKTLSAAIKKGGTTLRDFTSSEGQPGYFSNSLQVYGRGKLPCFRCKTKLQEIKQGQRSTVFCPRCQKSE